MKKKVGGDLSSQKEEARFLVHDSCCTRVERTEELISRGMVTLFIK